MTLKFTTLVQVHQAATSRGLRRRSPRQHECVISRNRVTDSILTTYALIALLGVA